MKQQCTHLTCRQWRTKKWPSKYKSDNFSITCVYCNKFTSYLYSNSGTTIDNGSVTIWYKGNYHFPAALLTTYNTTLPWYAHSYHWNAGFERENLSSSAGSLKVQTETASWRTGLSRHRRRQREPLSLTRDIAAKVEQMKVVRWPASPYEQGMTNLAFFFRYVANVDFYNLSLGCFLFKRA